MNKMLACMPSIFINFWMVKMYGNNIKFYEGTIIIIETLHSHNALP